MPDVAGIAIDPRLVDAFDNIQEGALYVVLENGEVWIRSTGGGEWGQLNPVPNTPAAEEADGGE